MLVCLLSACKSPDPAKSSRPLSSLSLKDLKEAASRFKATIAVPEYETTPEGVHQAVSNTIARANARLDELGQRDPAQLNFDNTLRALDDIYWEASRTGNRLDLVKETSTNAAVRDAATEAQKVFSEWAVGLDYREDVYAAIKAVADTHPAVEGEDARLLEETLRDYRRAGLGLPEDQRQEVESLRKKLSGLTTDFSTHVTQAKQSLPFTQEELEGVPESFLAMEGVKTGDDEYTIRVNVTFHYVTVMENARVEETRQKVLDARFKLASQENAALLQEILELRNVIAHHLGYASWADYKTEPKMAKQAATAQAFCENLVAGLQPKFDEELKEFTSLKIKETGDPKAVIHLWDWRYYSNQLKKEKYAVDSEQLRVFFPYDRVLDGMFRIYQNIFGLTFRPVEPPFKWIEDLRLYAVLDTQTSEPLGLFYLDMFPREGKYNHFAQFGLIEGKRLPNGQYQRPTVALVCNFPTPQPDKPSLLSHNEVETLFHEFGHALHSILTRANYARFSGTSVPRDFVEAPSQMLENWVWDKPMLDSFAADYRDPSRKIPEEILDQLKAAKLATIATFYRRQMSFALLDLALHSQVKAGVNALDLSNKILSQFFLPVPEGTTFVTYFNHLMHYDAAYYGYGWADAIAADLATVFEQSPRGYQDTTVGRRLRDEIYAPGDSRDVNESIRAFLGRERSLEPFLRTLGIQQSGAMKTSQK